jgi:hypothetical protein
VNSSAPHLCRHNAATAQRSPAVRQFKSCCEANEKIFKLATSVPGGPAVASHFYELTSLAVIQQWILSIMHTNFGEIVSPGSSLENHRRRCLAQQFSTLKTKRQGYKESKNRTHINNFQPANPNAQTIQPAKQTNEQKEAAARSVILKENNSINT